MQDTDQGRHVIQTSILKTAAICASTPLVGVLTLLLELPTPLAVLLPAFVGAIELTGLMIHENRRSLRRLEQTHAFVQRLIDVIPEPVYVKDAGGRYIIVNNAFIRLRQQPREAIVGSSARELAPDEQTMLAVAAEDQRVLAGETVFKEDHTTIASTGQESYRIVTKGSCLDTEGRPVIVGANFDISAMRRAEMQRQEALEQQTEIARNTEVFIQRLINVIPEPVYVKDASGHYIMINEAFARQRGQSQQEILNRTAVELAPNMDAADLVAQEDARVLAGASVYKEDITTHPVSGEKRYRVVTKGACLNASGNPVIVGANFDITRMRIAEQELQRALAEQTSVAERTRNFIQHLIDVIPYPFFVRDENSRFVLVNKALLTAFELTREQAIGHTPRDIHPDTAHAARSIREDREVLAGKIIQREDGGIHPAHGRPYAQIVIKGSCPDIEGKPAVVGINIDVTELRNSEARLANALEQLQSHHQRTLDFVQRVLDLLPYPVYVKDAQSRYIMVNEAMAHDHMIPREKMLNAMGIMESVDEEALQAMFNEDGEVLGGRRILREDHETHPVTGREIFRITAKGTCLNAIDEPVIVGASVDLTDLRLAERELKASFEREVQLRERTQDFIQRLIDVIPDPVYVKCEGSRYILVNDALAKFHSVSKDQLLKHGLPEPSNRKLRELSYQEDREVLAGKEILKEEYTIFDENGQEDFRIVCKRRSIYVDGTPVVVGIHYNITQWRLAERELKRLAQEDTLTGLANRRHFQTEAERTLARATRYPEPISLLMLDVDHFKQVNDAWGHQNGDEVLMEAVRRICQSLRTTDMPARWGGEEFIVLLPQTTKEMARQVAERLRQYFAAMPFTTSLTSLPVTVSIGATQWKPGEALDHLISRADTALYRAKEKGRNRVELAD